MTINELIVASKEQRVDLYNGVYVQLFFDPIYKRWYYNLYENNELKYAGIALNPGSRPLHNIASYYVGLIDKINDKTPYEPFNELGSRLGLLEIRQ